MSSKRSSRINFLFNCLLIANFLQYLEAGAVPALLLVISESFNMNAGQQGLLGGVVYLSLGSGGPFAGYVLRKFEHKTVILWAVLANMLFTFLWAMTPVNRSYSTSLFIFMRFMMGLCQCIVCVFLPLWTNENAPRKKRTTWMSYLQASVPFGVMIGYVIASACVYFSQGSKTLLGLLNWRWPFLIEIGLLTPLYLGLYFIPSEDISIKISNLSKPNEDSLPTAVAPNLASSSRCDERRPSEELPLICERNADGSTQFWMKLQSAEAIEEKKHRQSWRRTSLSASMFDPLSTRDIIKRSYDDIALLAEGNEDVFGSVAGFRWAGTSQIPSPTDSRNETPETSNREEVVGGIMYMDELDKSISGSASNRPSLSLPPLNIPGNAPSSSGYGTMAPVEPMRYESLRELRRKSMSEDGIVFGLNTPILGRRRTASGDTPDGSPTDKDRRRSRVGAFTAPKGKAKDTNSIVGIAIQEPMAPPSSSSKRQLSPSMSKMGEIAQHNGQPQSASRHQNQTMTQEEHPWYQQLYQKLWQGAYPTHPEAGNPSAKGPYRSGAQAMAVDMPASTDSDSASGSESEDDWPDLSPMPVRVQSPEGLAPIPFAFEEQQGGFRQVPSFHLTDRVSDPGPRCCNKLGDYLTCFGYLPRAFQYLFGWDDCCRSCFHRSSTRVRVGSHYKKHWTRSIRALLSMPVYRNLLGAMSALYFTVTGVQYWGTKYLLVSLHAPLLLVNALFVVTAATAPVLGVIFGGYIIDVFGGYKGSKRRVMALEIVLVLGLIGLACSLPITFCSSVFVAIGFLWLVLFFGGSILPACAGILVSIVPRYHRPTSASLSVVVFNMFGYCLSLVLSGYLMQLLQSYENHCDEVCAMTWGFRLVLFWSGFSALFLVNALRASYRQLRDREEKQRQLFPHLDEQA